MSYLMGERGSSSTVNGRRPSLDLSGLLLTGSHMGNANEAVVFVFITISSFSFLLLMFLSILRLPVDSPMSVAGGLRPQNQGVKQPPGSGILLLL